jgi:predicted enzyme related to lactoylglutathione lyase
VPLRDSVPDGAPVWIDLASSDPQRSQDFYARLFGWTVQEMGPDFGNYVNFSKNGSLVAGLVPNQQPDGPDGWTTYLSNPDAKAVADATRAAEGSVLLEPMPVMSLGSMAVVTDPSGGVVGVWQPEQHRGYGLSNEDGAPAWSELHTHDYSAAVRFYQQVFGWETAVVSDTAELRYTVFEKDGRQYAGIMDAAEFLPADIPSNWQVYFQADDVDATLARVEELGGAVVDQAMDTPYGRMAGVTDPTGAGFKLIKPPTG